jgi:hypothetical protein
MLREKRKGRKPRGESTDALVWDGLVCSNEEGSVMGPERRDGTGNSVTEIQDRRNYPHHQKRAEFRGLFRPESPRISSDVFPLFPCRGCS